MVVQDQLPEEEQRDVQCHESLVVVKVRHESVDERDQARQRGPLTHFAFRSRSLDKRKGSGDLMQALCVPDFLLLAKSNEQLLQPLLHGLLSEGRVTLPCPVGIDAHGAQVGFGQLGCCTCTCTCTGARACRGGGSVTGDRLQQLRPALGAAEGERALLLLVSTARNISTARSCRLLVLLRLRLQQLPQGASHGRRLRQQQLPAGVRAAQGLELREERAQRLLVGHHLLLLGHLLDLFLSRRRLLARPFAGTADGARGARRLARGPGTLRGRSSRCPCGFGDDPLGGPGVGRGSLWGGLPLVTSGVDDATAALQFRQELRIHHGHNSAGATRSHTRRCRLDP
mmetsp:Transcript_91912/g.297294  ORF Transcript_91912/g.297294 Transcript_91912/m.297294 type:complete len:342 (-) Transcript_91912:10-1035(-)